MVPAVVGKEVDAERAETGANGDANTTNAGEEEAGRANTHTEHDRLADHRRPPTP